MDLLTSPYAVHAKTLATSEGCLSIAQGDISDYELELECTIHIFRCDSCNAIEWFAKNDMQVNPGKFHFMLFSPMPTKQQVLKLCDYTSLMSENEVL